VIVTIGAGALVITVAYDASTGTRLWRSEFSGGDGAIGYPHAIVTSPDGAHVYVTGVVDDYYGTIAYDTATGWRSRLRNRLSFRSRSGRLRWRQRFVAAPAALALGPHNGRVVVTATGSLDQTGEAYVVTIADEA
jgi:DNA-binding beta-propeller fold protein YncE